jgi:hypothetical protein
MKDDINSPQINFYFFFSVFLLLSFLFRLPLHFKFCQQEVSTMRIGAEYFSSSLIPSISLQTMVSWASQKATKQANSREVPSQGKN